MEWTGLLLSNVAGLRETRVVFKFVLLWWKNPLLVRLRETRVVFKYTTCNSGTLRKESLRETRVVFKY